MGHFRELLVAWGPLGVLILSVVESLGVPNPGGTDWLLVIVTAARPADALICAVLATIGSVAGSMVFFEVIRKGGDKFLTQYTATGRGERFRLWFLRYGLATVFIAALVPIPILPLKVFCACAAAMRESRMRYMLVMIAGRVPRYAALAYLGAELGEKSWPWLKSHTWHLTAMGLVLLAALFGLLKWAGRTTMKVAPLASSD